MGAIRDREERDDIERVIGCVRLKWCFEGEGMEEAVDLEGFAETLRRVSLRTELREEDLPDMGS